MDDGKAKRLFIAIDLPAAHRDLLGELQEPVRGVRWTPPEQLHLTLRFLGDTEAEPQRVLTRHLEHVRVEPFILPLEGIGVFPPRGQPHTIWAGVGRAHPRLFQLRQQIDDALLAAGLNIDLRTFVAHITIGRCVGTKPGAVTAFLHKLKDFAGAPFQVDRFTLTSSELTPDGPIHRPERVYPLVQVSG